jgi:adenine-specific DNA-methyltransferase
MAKKSKSKTVETLKHYTDKRRNIPTAEFQSVVKNEEQRTAPLRYARNTDLDPQLVWRGKDEQDWSELIVHVPPLYIQEKVHPKVPTLTASPRARIRPSSISMIRTGPTA